MSDQPNPQPQQLPQDGQPKRFRIHLLVKADDGPIRSRPGGTTFVMGTDAAYRAACDPTVVMGHYDRGTTLPWGVRCQACRDTQEFADAGGHLPKPGKEDRPLESEE